jgi:serine phosphatase RsbU (regulator of sigma subunit)/anti-sigma regulatory factor (Ser/Thr protein kinase)
VTERKAKVVWSIRWIVTVAAVVLTAGAVVSVGAVAERNVRRALTAEIETRLLLDARTLSLASTGAMLGDYPELTLHPLAKELLARQPELNVIVVTDIRGVVQGHPDVRSLGQSYALPAGLKPIEDARRLARGETLGEDGGTLLAAVPVTHPDGRSLGLAVVGMPRTYLDRVIADARRKQLPVLALFLGAAVLVPLVLVSQLLRPIATLRHGIERIGRGELDRPLVLRDRTELGLLATAINQMAGELKQAQADLVERERLAHEMDLAKRIQTSLLPKGTTRTGAFVIQGYHRPAAEVGGDYYDVFDLPEGKVGVVVADVAGKGLAGCLVMSIVFSLLRAYRDGIVSPAALLTQVDRRLAETLEPGSFVTLFYGVLDSKECRLTYASAGHNPLVQYRARDRSMALLTTRGIPIGAIRGGAIAATLEDRTLELEPGDVLLQYTDGVNESMDARGEQFGLDRLGQAVSAAATGGAPSVIEGVVGAIGAWTNHAPPTDDETILVIAHETQTDGGGVNECVFTGDAKELLRRARDRGLKLTLPARMDALEGIGDWLRTCPPAPALSERGFGLLTTALYEVCANVVEHGYHEDSSRTLDLWWVPADRDETLFLVRDSGTPFAPPTAADLDFGDPRVRSKGRGIGLQIIRRATRETAYFPGTSEGNLTVLCFPGHREEAQRVRTP